MKILFLSTEGAGLSLARRMAEEGHSVATFVRRVGAERLGEGIVSRVHAWRPTLMDSDLVVCDSPGFGTYSKVLRGNGRPVFGCNYLADISLQEGRQTSLLKLLKLWRPPTEIPSDSIACTVQAWYNGRGWVRPFLVSLNEDRFMNDDVGPKVQSMGCLTMAARADYRLFELSLFPLERFLRKIGWRGPVNVGCSVWLGDVAVTGVYLGFHYDSAYTFIEGLQEPLADAIFETAMGIKKELKVTTFDFIVSARISVPPWPHALPNGELKGLPLGELSDKALKHIHLRDVYAEGKQHYLAGTTGVVCSATAVGRSVDEARNRVLRTVRNIPLPDKQYRTDVGAAPGKNLKLLAEYGYLS